MRKTSTVQKVPYLAPEVVTKIIPAPTDGWDAISPLAEMDPKRAVILENWVPRPGFIELRQGYTAHSQAGDTPVETLMIYRVPSGETMFAASGDSIYDVSAYGQHDVVVSGLGSARWQYIMFTPAGGTPVLQCVNGTDSLQQWDGTTWTVPVITGTLINGVTVDTADFVNIHQQKRRLWYVIESSQIAAFLPADAIQGPIDGSIDFGALWSKGGYLVAMSSWTVDGGSGPQDYALFLSSRGQMTLYAGTDPTNAATWSLVGTFDMSPPVSRRCLLRVGSDVGVITLDGVLPVSQVLPFDPSADRSVAVTARIQNAMALATQTSRDFFGWQLIAYPDQNLAILNVPIAENQTQQQFVMNALTGAWCKFTGWNANCFEIFNELLYWGGNEGQVNLGWSGGSDNGVSIEVDMQCAFNWFEEPGKIKRMTAIQPLLTVDGTISPTLAVDVDFNTSTAIAPITFIAGGTLWDVSLWDVALWPGGASTYTKWLSVQALGHALAVRLRCNIGRGNTGSSSVFDVAIFDTAIFDGVAIGEATLQINAFNAVLEMGGVV